jgi:UDP-glucose:(heptosyl)LPS alpha-1,3-glucosyltransferase
MKFAFCIFKYFPYGGLERDFIRILKACQQHGHFVDIYTMHWEGRRPSNAQVIVVPAKGWTNHRRCASFAANIANLLINKNYDAIVGFNRMPGLDVCYAADLCFVHNARQEHGLLYRLTSRYRIYAKFERAVFSMKSKTQILYIADQVKQQAIQYYQTPAARLHKLTPGIDQKFKPPTNAAQIRQQVRQKYAIDRNTKLVVLVGSNFKLKGVDRALRAVATLPLSLRQQTCLWIFGKDKPNKYVRLSKKLGVATQVKFMGVSDSLAKFLLAADLLIHPARREAAGMAIVDAIVSGCPVLATAVCGFASYIEDAKVGLVVPNPFKQQQLNHLLKIALTTDEWQQWHKNGLLYGQTHDLYSRDTAVAVIEAVSSLIF